MPRRTREPILSPIRAYYAFMRKRATREQKELDAKARKRRERTKRRIEHKEQRDLFTEKRLNDQIDKIAKHPSKLAASQLRAIMRAKSTPAAIKARASALILQWAFGDFSYDRIKRRRQQIG